MEYDLIVTSPAFKDGESIPKKYSGEDIEISPPLFFENIIEEAKSIAIIMQDINSPLGSINHWVIWNIPPQSTLPEDIPKTNKLPNLGDAIQGKNIMRKTGYMGPKPPWGTHTYTFYVYVLDTILTLPLGANKKKLKKAIEGHILQYGTLSGIYSKNKK